MPGRAGALLLALRPKQWSKNALLFAGMLFTLNQPHPPEDYALIAGSFVLFCLLSGCTYLLNDINDVEADRLHPKKRNRPIASGRLPVAAARAFAFTFLPLSLVAAYFLINPAFFAAALLYVGVTMAYSYSLKNVVVVDVMTLASGFVLRAVAGAVAIQLEPSVWLLLCTGLLALFLALNKRRGELVALGGATSTRPILAEYSVPLLDQMINIVASTCVMAYSLYTFFSETAKDRPYLMATIPFVLYGLFRYLYLSFKKGQGEAPELVLSDDLPLRINLLLWTLTVVTAMLAVSGR